MDKNTIFPKSFRNKWTHTIVCVMVVLILSLIPQKSLPPAPFTSVDLLVHMMMYGGLSYCIILSLFDDIIQNKIPKIISIIPFIIGLFGLIIEILQKTLPIHRYFSWGDALCNFLGACSFYFLVLILKNKTT